MCEGRTLGNSVIQIINNPGFFFLRESDLARLIQCLQGSMHRSALTQLQPKKLALRNIWTWITNVPNDENHGYCGLRLSPARWSLWCVLKITAEHCAADFRPAFLSANYAIDSSVPAVRLSIPNFQEQLGHRCSLSSICFYRLWIRCLKLGKTGWWVGGGGVSSESNWRTQVKHSWNSVQQCSSLLPVLLEKKADLIGDSSSSPPVIRACTGSTFHMSASVELLIFMSWMESFGVWLSFLSCQMLACSAGAASSPRPAFVGGGWRSLQHRITCSCLISHPEFNGNALASLAANEFSCQKTFIFTWKAPEAFSSKFIASTEEKILLPRNNCVYDDNLTEQHLSCNS